MISVFNTAIRKNRTQKTYGFGSRHPRIVYSPEALEDLVKIGDYIRDELQNPSAALNTINTIQNHIDKLKNFPYIGTPLSSVYDGTDADVYRFVVCLNYLVFYRVAGNMAFIDRILHQKQDYIRILFKEFPFTSTDSTL